MENKKQQKLDQEFAIEDKNSKNRKAKAELQRKHERKAAEIGHFPILPSVKSKSDSKSYENRSYENRSYEDRYYENSGFYHHQPKFFPFW